MSGFQTKLLSCLAKLGFVVISFGLSIALLEWVSSFFVSVPAKYVAKHPRLNHTWYPNGEVTVDNWAKTNPQYPESYRHVFNRQGWLETYDISKEKPPKTYRIFYLGDSFTEGCVKMTDSVASQVETFLNQQVRENARQFEVINTGTSSYSPLIYYILTRYYLIDYQPDLLVINVDMTDNFDDWKYRQSLVTNTAGEPWAVLPSNILKRKFIETNRGLVAANVLMKTIVLLEQYSYTFNWLRKLLYHPDLNESGIPQPEKTEEKPTTSEFYQHWAWCKHKWDSATQGHVDFTLQMLGLLIDFCKHHDIRVMITAVPHYEQFTKDKQGEFIWSHKPFEAIRNLADEKDVVYLDSYAALAPKIQGSRQTEFYYFNDMHFNPKGNDLWAKAHIRAFIDHGDQLLPRDSH